MLRNKQITVIVTGGIAAYKMPDFVRMLIKKGAQVRVAMTPNATRFVTAETFEVLTGYPVLIDGRPYPERVGHVALADWSDMMLVMPATANTISALASARADNEALSALLGSHSLVMIIPAMNHNMWHKASLQRQVETLRLDGYRIIDPAIGFLAEGYEGKGRMPEPIEVLQAVEAYLAISDEGDIPEIKGQRVLISAGGTREAIDPVRYLSNRSSGKMGLALAHVACALGAQVTLVRTENTLNLPVLPEIETVTVSSAQDMYDVMHEREKGTDIIIMAAAVSDYRMQNIAENKMKKDKTQAENQMKLNLVENPDILASLNKEGHYVVGFAAETQDVVAYAQDKLERKQVDMIVVNDVSNREIGFNSEDNAVHLVRQSGVLSIDQQSKMTIAARIFKAISEDIAKDGSN